MRPTRCIGVSCVAQVLKQRVQFGQVIVKAAFFASGTGGSVAATVRVTGAGSAPGTGCRLRFAISARTLEQIGNCNAKY